MPVLSNQANVSYKIKNATLTQDSNITTLNHIIPSMTIVKLQNKLEGLTGETVTFTIKITNTSLSDSATNVVLTDNLTTAGYTFVNDSCKINGQASTDKPQSGITLGTMQPLALITVTFDATIN